MIQTTSRDDVTVLHLTHGSVNALDGELMGALADSLEELERNGARAIVLTGTDAVFSAGADLLRILEDGPDYVTRARPNANRAFEKLFTFPRPIVAAVNGHAIAGGCVLALACDHRVASSGDHRIGLPELRVGVPFPVWALETVRFAVAPPHLQRLMTSGKLCSVDEALERGLVDEVVEPTRLLERAVEIAGRMASITPATFALTKRQLREPFVTRARASSRTDDEGFAIWISEEARDSMRRFVDRTLGRQGGGSGTRA